MSERRTHTALVRLTDAEWAAWERAARDAGYGRTATWARAVIAGAIEGGTGPAREDAGARELAGQVARIGSNLNQIARALNVAMNDGGPKLELEDVQRAVEAAHVELRALRAAVES